MPGILWALVFVVGAIIVGYLPAQLMRKWYGAIQPADTRALASDVMARIGAVHGLILALVFSSAHVSADRIQTDVTAEAVAATQVYFNAKRYGAHDVQSAAEAYIHAVVDHDWASLHDTRRLSDQGWLAWRKMLDASLALTPRDRRQELLAGEIHAGVLTVESMRQIRGYEGDQSLSLEFWVVAIVGLLLIATLLFVHKISRLHQALMAMYSAFTGLTLFMIYDMSHPFSGDMSVQPTAFLAALDALRTGI
jgi:hypothetical protein